MTSRSIEASMHALKNMPIKQAMLKAGYSEASAQNPINLTRTKAYKTLVIPKLKKHGVTIDKYIKNIGEAMNATKVITSPTEPDHEVIDHTVRLAGNKQAEKLLKIDKMTESDNASNDSKETTKELLELLQGKEIDGIKLAEITFKE